MVGREPAHPELARIDARAADPAGDKQRLSAGLPRDVLERRLLSGVADRIDEPAKSRRIAPGEHHERPVGHPHDRRDGQGRQPLGGYFADQPGLEADHPGGANEVGFVGRAAGQRQFARELHRIGGDAIIGGDPAQRPQARVERGRFGAKRRSLHHRRFMTF